MTTPVPQGWPFGGLQMFGYDVIMADPPWTFELRSEAGIAKAPQGQYACMSTEAIKDLPVHLLAKRDCWLWLWGSFALKVSTAEAVMAAWRFRYVTGGVWIKRNRSGKLAFGQGYVLRGNAEPFLIGRVGEPEIRSRSIRNVIEAPAGRHSEKPLQAYQTAERLFGPAFRADLFSRRTRPGWAGWGDEAGLFDDPAAAPTRRAPVPTLRPRSPGDQLDLTAEAA